MAINTEHGFHADCDNPECPGLPDGVVAEYPGGWLVVYSGGYTAALEQLVACSYRCAGAIFTARASAGTPVPPIPAPE